ncbi:MAG: methyltransferase [Actinomyces dentalis]
MSPASARSASESSSFPPPAATPEQAASLRADLADSGWGVEAVAALLGEVADAALRREIRLPALRAVRAALAPDHVLGVGGAGLTLAGLTPRTRVGTALDLGCGCGIQTLYLLRHAEHVVATDISARALAFTAFNAALAGVSVTGSDSAPGAASEADVKPGPASGSGSLELLRGSLLEPVVGRRFDLIASNPPFVLTPPAVREAGLPLMEYRDAGRPVLPGLVAGLGEHLGAGAAAVMLGNWEHRRGRDWRRDVAAWVPDDLDAWVVEREAQDPVEYAALWLRDGGLAPERDLPRFEAALEAWIADFEARGVEGVGLGYLIVHRPDPDSDGAPRAPWRVLEEVATRPAGPLGEHVARCLEVRSGLAAMDDDAVAGLRPVTAPDVTEERHLRPGAGEPDVILIRQGGGFGRVVEADTALAALVGVADGELSVAQIATAVAALTGADEAALRARMVAATRALAAEGFVDL